MNFPHKILMILLVFFILIFEYCSASLFTNSHNNVLQPLRNILVTMQHSGSHFFGGVLGQLKLNGRVVGLGELCAPSRTDWMGIDCITRIKLMYGLPDVDFNILSDTAWVTHFPSCKTATDAGECAMETILSAPMIQMILHANHGWGDPDWRKSLFEMRNIYQKVHNIDIKLIILYRTNFIAHHIAASASKRDPNEVLTPVHLSLPDVVSANAQRSLLYHQFFMTMPEKDISSCLYVTYEHLLNHHETFSAIARFLEVSTITQMNVTSDSQHHTNETGTYLLNLNTVVEELKENKYPLLNECMLHDNCGPILPEFCNNPKLLCYL